MPSSVAVVQPPVLSTTARAGIAPVAEPYVAPRGAFMSRLAWAADIVGTLAMCLVIPVGILIVGIPIALVVRGVLYLLGQL